ncbi:UDP-glucosyltransferase 2 [Drosophila ficusphila]|uniref:UDP-glucosyltransferase 2 n=1 Tax=Drosophila ficusphila TaxID=30025 RepID=UPI0007E62643|nr:UDP-glucosyltransferase 2 [Drosophila ficusphila]
MIKYSVIACLLVILLGTETQISNGANILGIFGTHSPSHVIVHMAVMKTLADRGHNITVVTQMKPKLAAHENITVIVAPPTPERQKFIKEYMAETSNDKTSIWKTFAKAVVQAGEQFEGQMEFMVHPSFKELYEIPQTKFDLVFLGSMANDFQLGIAAKLNCPVIITWVGVPLPFMDSVVGNVNDPSYVPSLNVVLDEGQNTMNFKQRFGNFFKHSFLSTIYYLLNWKMNQMYIRAFANESSTEFPTYYEMKRRISLLFYNYHSPSEGPIRPTVPASIEIGGIQVKEQPDPLPKELKEFLDNADDGAIFFSLGTNVNTNTFRPDVVDILYKVLSKLPQRVVWKWEDPKNKPGNASNIYFNNWLPQDDILAHPKTKLFITHAGKGGVAEAQYHGVPMLAIPIFGDQQGNAEIMTKSGFGRWLDIVTLTAEELEESIHEVLENPSYRETIGKFSNLYRDRPLTARQSVVYWTEYVLRHRGAFHLQSPLIHMDFVSRNNLDVHVVVLIVSLVLFYIFIVIFKILFRKIINVVHGHSYQSKAPRNKLKDN